MEKTSCSDVSSYDHSLSSDISLKSEHSTNIVEVSQVTDDCFLDETQNLTQLDLYTMEDENLINGDIINQFARHIEREYKKTNQRIVKTYFYDTFLLFGWEDSRGKYFKPYAISDKKPEFKWMSSRRETISLDTTKIFIPIYVDVGVGHWVLVVRVLEVEKSIRIFKFYYFDSLNSTEQMNTIKKQLSHSEICKYPDQIPKISWELVPCLRQSRVECGARVCQHLLMVWNDTNFSDDMYSNLLRNIDDYGGSDNAENIRIWLRLCINTNSIHKCKC